MPHALDDYKESSLLMQVKITKAQSKKKVLTDSLELFSWWLLPDLNWGHKALQASALPTELKSRNVGSVPYVRSRLR